MALYDIESRVEPQLLEEAIELVRNTREYTWTEPEAGYYQLVSKNPDYHVEITTGQEGILQSKCPCAVFKKSKSCKHAVAALILLRDQVLRQKRSGTRSKKEHPALEDILLKMKAPELRALVKQYASSHVTFRAEVLAQHLHLLKKPDYQSLLAEITPIDKYGRIKLNRNNIKTVRNIVAILLRQAQELLRDMALREVLQLLHPLMAYLYRMLQRLPQFREQLLVDLKHGTRLFEALCRHTMAPRLQDMVIQLALDITDKESYVVPKGSTPLLLSAEPFILDEKNRKAALQLVRKKWNSDPSGNIIWPGLLVRWNRIWNLDPELLPKGTTLQSLLPEIILAYSRQGEQDDVLYALKQLNRQGHEDPLIRAAVTAGLKAARQTGDLSYLEDLAFEVSLAYHDPEAWDLLASLNQTKAARVLDTVSQLNPAGENQDIDHFLLRGLGLSGLTDALLERLKQIKDIELLTRYDSPLFPTRREEVEDLYALWIQEIRETYGGVIARQKLSNIFGHLKSIGLQAAVTDKIKRMEKKTVENNSSPARVIRGFVFDLDGVIVDTAVHHFASWKKVMALLGADITDEDDLHTRGASRMESLEYLLQRYSISLSPEEKEMWAARKNELYLEAIEKITPADLLPGALKFLVDTRQAGLKLALGSASKNARGVLQKLQIEDRFDAILDGHDTVESKPHPEIFTKACQALSLNPEEVVVFEDAAKGVQAAIAAGCQVVGLGDPVSLQAADIVISGLDVTSPQHIIAQLS